MCFPLQACGQETPAAPYAAASPMRVIKERGARAAGSRGESPLAAEPFQFGIGSETDVLVEATRHGGAATFYCCGSASPRVRGDAGSVRRMRLCRGERGAILSEQGRSMRFWRRPHSWTSSRIPIPQPIAVAEGPRKPVSEEEETAVRRTATRRLPPEPRRKPKRVPRPRLRRAMRASWSAGCWSGGSLAARACRQRKPEQAEPSEPIEPGPGRGPRRLPIPTGKRRSSGNAAAWFGSAQGGGWRRSSDRLNAGHQHDLQPPPAR